MDRHLRLGTLTLIIAAAYYITAIIGQILAIPLGNITVFWPPSGLALAAVLLKERQALPGIVIGALLANLTSFSLLPMLAATMIALGSALQPLVAVALLRRFSARIDPFSSRSSALRFAAAIPIFTLVSCSIGVVTLILTGQLSSTAAFAWLNWWIGDSLGVLFFTPAIYLLFNGEYFGDRKWLLYLTLVMAGLGFSVMIIAILLSYLSHISTESERYSELANSRAALIEAISRFDSQYSDNDVDGGWRNATISQVQEAFTKLGDEDASTQTDFRLALFEAGEVNYQIFRHSEIEETPAPWKLEDYPERPLALIAANGESGVSIVEFAGIRNLAAYAPLPTLGGGLVVGASISHIRAPFIFASAVTVLITWFAVLISVYLFQRVSAPLLSILERKSDELANLVDQKTVALQQGEEQFRELLNSAPDAMLIFNDQGIIQMINRQLTRITGFGAADVLGKSVDKFLPEDVKSEHAQHMSRFMQHPQGGIVGRDRKLFCARKDGTEFPVDIALSPIRSSFDKLVAASIRDISDRIAYEESLEANELRLEQAFRSGKMEAWEMELETQQSSSSLFLYESFGYKPEDVAPGEDPWRAIIEKDDLARLSVSLQSFRRGEKSRYRETYRVRSASGEYRWIESTATPSLISSDGKVVACVGARVDITERMNSELTLKNKMAELEDFNKLAVDRELRMIELKKEINNLLHQLNKKEKYVVTEQ